MVVVVEEVVMLTGVREGVVLGATVEVELDESFRIFWGRIGILEALEDMWETLEWMEEASVTRVGCGGDVESDLSG